MIVRRIVLKGFLVLQMACLLGQAYDSDLSLPEKITDIQDGEISRSVLLSSPQLILVANRDAFELIEETAEVFTYPKNTVWVPNVSAAPGWVIRAFIKPALKKTAKKVPFRVIYDPEGDWTRSLRIVSEDDDYLGVFYADQEGVKKVMEKMIPAKQYKKKEEKKSLGEEILTAWNERKNFE